MCPCPFRSVTVQAYDLADYDDCRGLNTNTGRNFANVCKRCTGDPLILAEPAFNHRNFCLWRFSVLDQKVASHFQSMEETSFSGSS